jgi:fucose 4-O-acetylase-like acetyltransferase
MQDSKTKRIGYLDTAKGIGILTVCIQHACTNQPVAADTQMADLIRFVMLFHMALFFFINGMLYREKYAAKPISGIWKKFKAYYIPFVTYNLIYWVFHNLFARLHLISGALDEKDYAYVGIRAYLVSLVKTLVGFRQRFAGAMWFLLALLVMSTLFILADYVATKWFPKRRMTALVVIVLVLVVGNRLFSVEDISYLPHSMTQLVYWGINGLLYFLLGYLYTTYRWNEKLAPYKIWLIPVLFVVLLITVALMRPAIVSVITNPRQVLPFFKYLLFAGICLCGVIMTLLFSQLKKVESCRVLQILGQYSLHIMCLHFLAFKVVSLIIIGLYGLPIERLAEYPVLTDINGLWWIVYAVAGLCIPILLVKIYEKMKRMGRSRK